MWREVVLFWREVVLSFRMPIRHLFHTHVKHVSHIFLVTHVKRSSSLFVCAKKLPVHTSRDTYKWDMFRINVQMRDVSHMNSSCDIYVCVMSHMWKIHLTYTNESCDTYERVMSHIWGSHVTRIWMSQGTLMNESYHTYEWVISVISHIWMSHITDVNESWMSHVTRTARIFRRDCVSHGTHIFLDGYCSTVQGLLDWFEVDLGFTELLFIQIEGWL